MDHLVATTIISSVIGLFKGGLPRYAFVGAFYSIFLISPLSYWLLRNGLLKPHVRAANIFYDTDISQDEVDRIRHLDAIEAAAFDLKGKAGYGLIQKDQRYV